MPGRLGFSSLLLFISLFSLIRIVHAENATPPVMIYVAKQIITMDPIHPRATAVAVKDGLIYSVGSLAEMKSWMKPGSFTVNKDYANDTITPGMIEAHCHTMLMALLLSHPYAGYFDFPGINGVVMKGAKSKAEVIKHLIEANEKMTDPKQLLFAWNYDPIFHNGENLTAEDLDQVSKTRPVFVLNASGHIGYVNTVILQKTGYNARTNINGVVKGKDGKPTGVLVEMRAVGPALSPYLPQLSTAANYKQGLYDTAELAHRKGLTTIADMLFGGANDQTTLPIIRKAASDPNFPVRMVFAYDGPFLYRSQGEAKGVTYLKDLQNKNTDKMRFGQVKFISDGSLQAFTARQKWPGYFNGAANGISYITTTQLKQQMLPFWKAGIPIHIHVDGNEATESALDVLEYLQHTVPRKTARFVLEHNQMANPGQFRRAAALGAATNIFANHVYYWGDQHYTITLGPDRANLLDDAAAAKRAGVIFSLHSDAPATPLDPLHSMWAAVNRTTASGRVLGKSERLTAEEALRAVTINAAYLLKMEDEIGSIEIGKRADFTVLGSNPLTQAPEAIKNIPVIATIQSGTVYPVQAGVLQTALMHKKKKSITKLKLLSWFKPDKWIEALTTYRP